jgi:hypothetical protein
MNIHFERSGGFAGLRLSQDLDSADLSPDERSELDRLVEAAHFFDLPADVRAANPGADRFQYNLTVNQGPREHTVALDEAAIPENLRPLLNWLMAKARKR